MSTFWAVAGCGMQSRPDAPAHGKIESKAATGIGAASVKVELAGVTKSTSNFHSVRASWGAPNGPPKSMEPM